MQPFDFNLRHLRALGEIRTHGSLNRAAEAAGLSQPALTQGLGKIERQLGQQLFHRTHDGMAATPAGLALSERAERAFAFLAAGPRRGGARGFARPPPFCTSPTRGDLPAAPRRAACRSRPFTVRCASSRRCGVPRWPNGAGVA